MDIGNLTDAAGGQLREAGFSEMSRATKSGRGEECPPVGSLLRTHPLDGPNSGVDTGEKRGGMGFERTEQTNDLGSLGRLNDGPRSTTRTENKPVWLDN